jgi:NitT/TauT family transport system substrate-binding protein
MEAMARGEVDFFLIFAGPLVTAIDAGQPITVVAGVHVGCFELFAHDPIRTISDLKGKRIGIDVVGGAKYLYVAIMAASVGLDPHADIEWVAEAEVDPLELFAAGEVDAFLGFPPEPQELRARRTGRVIVNTIADKPWSQYFCCVMAGNREFVRNHPIATKRVVRALLKANEICAAQPDLAARQLVEGGFAERYDYALETLTDIRFAQWREFDAEDSMRFFALRLHEVGMIASSPNQLLAEGTDWRFLEELRRELKS